MAVSRDACRFAGGRIGPGLDQASEAAAWPGTRDKEWLDRVGGGGGSERRVRGE